MKHLDDHTIQAISENSRKPEHSLKLLDFDMSPSIRRTIQKKVSFDAADLSAGKEELRHKAFDRLLKEPELDSTAETNIARFGNTNQALAIANRRNIGHSAQFELANRDESHVRDTLLKRSKEGHYATELQMNAKLGLYGKLRGHDVIWSDWTTRTNEIKADADKMINAHYEKNLKDK